MSDCSIEKITPFMISKRFHSKMEQNSYTKQSHSAIRHFEVARESGSRWLSKRIVGLFWASQNSPTWHFDNYLDQVSSATSKWSWIWHDIDLVFNVTKNLPIQKANSITSESENRKIIMVSFPVNTTPPLGPFEVSLCQKVKQFIKTQSFNKFHGYSIECVGPFSQHFHQGAF